MKKAKICQKTGKGQRNVTAYCISGDGLTELSTHQTVSSKYVEIMKENKAKQQKRAQSGEIVYTKRELGKDISQGLSSIRNIINHALHLEEIIKEIKMKIGEDQYEDWLSRTLAILTLFDH